ncbi:DNA alkylation repair protein [Candidatus Nomurabacteria bacterium]|nr:DNA alkylation repair protein [Candidatus Nomurabacteria bacterium]
MTSIQKELKKYANSQKAVIFQRFFKTAKGQYGEGDRFIGVTVPEIRKVAKQFIDLSLVDVLQLLHSSIHEDRLCALLILVEQYNKGDLKKQKQIFQAYLKNYQYINNWDLVDLSAPKIVGAYLFVHPQEKNILEKLAQSNNLWKKRVAMVSTFYFIYQGQSAETIKLAKILLNDSHDLIHKATGWMLREVGKRCEQKILLDFLNQHYQKMPRTCLRYAIERLPEKTRQAYLKSLI